MLKVIDKVPPSKKDYSRLVPYIGRCNTGGMTGTDALVGEDGYIWLSGGKYWPFDESYLDSHACFDPILGQVTLELQ